MKNLKTGVQLRIGLAIIISLVILLGAFSWWHTNILWQQTKGLYEHPLSVTRSLGELKADILLIHRDLKDIFLTRDEKVKVLTIQQIASHEADAFRQLDVIKNQYLGPKSDVDSALHDFIIWNSMRAETLRLIYAGQNDEAAKRTIITGDNSLQVEKLMDHIGIISDFAINKGDEFYFEAQNRSRDMNMQLAFFVVFIICFSIVVSYFLIRSIRKPLAFLVNASDEFGKGNLSARCDYQGKNEFGKLTSSFNQLAGSIQREIVERENTAQITVLMLENEDLNHFSNTLLNRLITKTGAQVGALFLLDETTNTYSCFESIGLIKENIRSFDANSREGEFGMAVSTRKWQLIKQIPDDSVMMFATVTGVFKPREIITIPVISGTGIPAIISLASLHPFYPEALSLIENLLPLLSTRINGLLAVQKIRDFSEQLNIQNKELQAQKHELSIQTVEMRMQNTELEAQKQQLNEANRLKTSFLSNMSHELRTPLNSVIALSGVLNRRLEGQIPEEEYSYLEVIERNGKLLLALINDILDISRIEAGYEETEISQFNIHKLASEVCLMISPQAKLKNIELMTTGDQDVMTVTADYQKCRQILQNLVGNAVKFTERGSVKVNLKQAESSVRISVTDTGIGIAEQHLPHIFDEFRQADGSTARRYGGTGLGLAIARKYAYILGGNITVSSKPGEGSVFTFVLPLKYHGSAVGKEEVISTYRQNIMEDGQAMAVGFPQKTILLVDDSDPAIIQLTDILTGGGFQTRVASNGAEAISMLEQLLPDGIILDLMMPDIDGFTVLKTVRENPRTAHIPVLILTAKHITKAELSVLKQNNIHQLIQKGDINRIELLRAVTTMVTMDQSKLLAKAQPLDSTKPRPQILIVEDNPDNMLTLKAMLHDRYSIIEAVNGKIGVEMALIYKPNLILMDIALPEMNGIEAFRAIRKGPETNHIPIVAVTASAMAGERATIIAEGFNGYISKPVDIGILEKCVRDWVES
ncbi:MAG: response regulator [Bacteroidetes bacterium]|nr:response regulator [Bacteroidota bacterium]